MNAILMLPVIDGPIPWIFGALSIAALIVLLVRRLTRRWVLLALAGMLVGAVIGYVVYLWGNSTRAFGGFLPPEVSWWLIASFAAAGLALASLWRTRWWRRTVAIIAVPVFLITGGLGINAYFGLDRTVADVLGIVISKPIVLPTDSPSPTPSASPTPAGPLWATWRPPADMPHLGSIGTVTIPGVVSGFKARQAGLYLPPAALVANAPQLPLLIFMMGYPGTPAPERIGAVMQTFAAAHHGLAPIVIIADQIGTVGGDPACADSKHYGQAQTYIMTDVVAWARAHLNVNPDPKYWAIGGYSNGATCAIKYATLAPTEWASILSVSPEEYPGVDYSARVIRNVYEGNRAAWEAAKPVNLLATRHGTLGGLWAVVTTGSLDTVFGPGTRRLAEAMKAAGIDTNVLTIPGVGHVGDNFPAGVEAGMTALYPRLGLAPAG